MRDSSIGGTSTAGKGKPVSRPINTAAAVVEVACEDGKLNLLGVETFTCTDAWLGRGRRITRLMTIEAACAPTAPTATPAHCLRRGLSTSQPAAAMPTQPSACSPKCDMPRAADTTAGLLPRVACTALMIATSGGACLPATGSADTG